MKLNSIKGNTFYINPKYIDLGLYRITNNHWILIDTGYEKTASNELVPFFNSCNISIIGILCTHGHLDHVGGNHIIKKQYNSRIASPYIESIFGENSYNMYIIRNNFRFTVTKEALPSFKCPVDDIISSELNTFDFLDIPFKIISLNGHSPNQVGYITPDNVAYLADSLISENLLKKTKIPYIFDIRRDLETKKNLKKLNCDYYILSHEGVYQDITHLIDLNIAHTNNAIESLLSIFDTPASFDSYTASVINKLNLGSSVKKIAYIQEMLRSFVTYFLQQDLIDAFEDKGKIIMVKK